MYLADGFNAESLSIKKKRRGGKKKDEITSYQIPHFNDTKWCTTE